MNHSTSDNSQQCKWHWHLTTMSWGQPNMCVNKDWYRFQTCCKNYCYSCMKRPTTLYIKQVLLNACKNCTKTLFPTFFFFFFSNSNLRLRISVVTKITLVHHVWHLPAGITIKNPSSSSSTWYHYYHINSLAVCIGLDMSNCFIYCFIILVDPKNRRAF